MSAQTPVEQEAERLRVELVDELRSMGVRLSSDGGLVLTEDGAWDARTRPRLAAVLAST